VSSSPRWWKSSRPRKCWNLATVRLPRHPLRPLRQVGDYRVIREAGRGGMGVVYEAEQVSLGRRVALKLLPRQVSQDLKMQARFRREARSAAQLHHTNIVPVFEVGKDGETSYYAMQFIQGQGLDTVIDELRRLKERAFPTGPARKPELRTCRSRPGRLRQHRPGPAGQPNGAVAAHGRYVPEPRGTSNPEATAAVSDRRDPDETEAPPASENSPAAGVRSALVGWCCRAGPSSRRSSRAGGRSIAARPTSAGRSRRD